MNRPRTFLLLAVGLIAVVWWGTQNIWRSPAYYPGELDQVELSGRILSAAEYGELIETHARPYVYAIESAPGALLMYGAEHTRDPRDPQIDDIQAEWDAFGPSVALVEGRLDFLIDGFMDPVAELGEGGWVNKLARRDHVPSFTWELSRDQEVALMLERFPREHVALYYFLRPYVSSLRFGKPEDPDAVVQQTIEERKSIPGLEGTFESVEEIDRAWKRDFADLPDWRDTSDQFGWPGYLLAVSETANVLRDEHLARLVIHLVQDGERVFVAAGSAHAVSLEPELRAGLSEPPRE